jgi:hypothetical protein
MELPHRPNPLVVGVGYIGLVMAFGALAFVLFGPTP